MLDLCTFVLIKTALNISTLKNFHGLTERFDLSHTTINENNHKELNEKERKELRDLSITFL